VRVGVLDSHPQLDEEQLMEEVFNQLKVKLSIDEEFVSMNALELFSRDKDSQKGLHKAMTVLVEDCAQRQKM